MTESRDRTARAAPVELGAREIAEFAGGATYTNAFQCIPSSVSVAADGQTADADLAFSR